MNPKTIKKIKTLIEESRHHSEAAQRLFKESLDAQREAREAKTESEKAKIIKLVIEKQRQAIAESRKADILQKKIIDLQRKI